MTNSSLMPALSLQDIRKAYKQADDEIVVLRGANFDVAPGEMVALLGPSGAGKSTLLQIAGLLETPDSGRINLGSIDAEGGRDKERTRLRLAALGFVYQFSNLLPEFTAVENVMLPQLVAGVPRFAAAKRAKSLLGELGLDRRLSHLPAELSGGEQQRCAIARALANAPDVLLADEPTGNLDSHTAESVFVALSKAVKNTGLSAVVATHNRSLAIRMDRTVKLEEGLVVDK